MSAFERAVYKSYGYVENLVHQLQRFTEAQEDSRQCKTFWLADYRPVVLAEWASQIAKAFGSRPIRTVPVSLLRIAAAAGDVAGRSGMASR
jgi:GlcNAc-P-P-Und epimerase